MQVTKERDRSATSAWRAVILRMPLKDLATGGSISFSVTQDGLGTITPVQGATNTMYLAAHINNFGMRIYRFVEPQGGFNYFDKVVDPWWPGSRGSMSCPAPDGNNFCGRTDNKIRTGWVHPNGYDNIIGFMWNVGQNSFRPDYSFEPCTPETCFAFPYINAAVFLDDADPATDDLVYISRPYIWSDQTAWLYSFTSPAGINSPFPPIGIAAFSGGGTQDFPAINFGVANGNDLEHGPNWKMFGRLEGTDAPSSNAWGDYLRVRPYTMTAGGGALKCPLWIGSGYGQWGATGSGNEIHPLFYIYGVELPSMSRACPA